MRLLAIPRLPVPLPPDQALLAWNRPGPADSILAFSLLAHRLCLVFTIVPLFLLLLRLPSSLSLSVQGKQNRTWLQ